ncbi:MAG: polysaccharide pyruvyl transferase family protein [Planctomycetota bacterium]
MLEKSKTEKKNLKICLLGVSFDTGNMGVSALAESSIKIILNRWPDAEITLLGTRAADREQRLEISGREVRVRILHLRFCKNVFLRSHCGVLLLNALLLRLLPWRKVRNLLCRLNPYVKMFLETDMAFDVTGGDSFSDIYGMRRFLVFGFLQKWIITQFGKELILLPQTYGPCRRPVTRMMARAVLKRASVVYARDRSGVEYVRGLLRNQDVNGKVRFVPDVAFVLDPHKPDHIDVGALEEVRTKDSIVVGLNISGLLFNGGYTHANMFSLKINYRELIYSVIDFLMKDKRVLVLLVPHVFTPSRTVEDDPGACRDVYRKLSKEYPGRIFLTQGRYNHNDIKYIIGLCDFFIGSRMHACIAALSQSIPAVGIAYSKKFQGVFDSIELESCVADAYRCKRDELIAIVGAAFERRDQIRTHLNKVIPEVQANIMNMFNFQSDP